ncbi:MAG: sensor histidine kinase [Fimbriimonadaceae bacterium]
MPALSDAVYASFLGVLSRSTSEDEMLAELAAELRHAAKSDGADILIADGGEGLVLRASTEMPEMNNRFRLGKLKGLSGKALAANEPIFIGNEVERDPSYARIPGILDGTYQSIAVVPLRAHGGQPTGVVTFKRATPWRFTPTVRSSLVRLGELTEQCIRAFHNAYNAGAHVNRLGALTEVSRTISSSPYLEEILQLLVNLTAQRFRYLVCTVRLLDESREELVLRATQASVKAYQRKRAIKVGESIAGRAIAENRPIIVPDVKDDEDYIGHDLAEEQGLRSMICVPLTIQDRAVGVLTCYTGEVHEFPEDEVAALETLAKQAAFAIENAKFQVRDTLMQEMHHRVKNNLQQVASLMRLQLRHGQYKSLEEALNDTLARILAIASVHDLLSREDLDHVAVRSIADALVQYQLGSLMLPGKRIKFEVRGDDVTLSVTHATQIALVLNELMLNAVEHGFKSADDGEIHITVEERAGTVSLWVANNGDELPSDFDLSQAHLGLQIVENLTRALNGRFKLSNILGWTVGEVKFTRFGSE